MFRRVVRAQVQWGARTFPRPELMQSVANVSERDIEIATPSQRQMRGKSAEYPQIVGTVTLLPQVFVSTSFGNVTETNDSLYAIGNDDPAYVTLGLTSRATRWLGRFGVFGAFL